jgi:hypothetical protein
MNLTRKVKHSWANGWGQDYPDFASKRDIIILEMMLAEKTDGSVVNDGEFFVTRFFSDQAAADEWVTFITQNAPVENPVTILEVAPHP